MVAKVNAKAKAARAGKETRKERKATGGGGKWGKQYQNLLTPAEERGGGDDVLEDEKADADGLWEVEKLLEKRELLRPAARLGGAAAA
eukprot:SAG31_NODE_8213_length_1495_cov_2.133954_1_plen_87_part_10